MQGGPPGTAGDRRSNAGNTAARGLQGLCRPPAACRVPAEKVHFSERRKLLSIPQSPCYRMREPFQDSHTATSCGAWREVLVTNCKGTGRGPAGNLQGMCKGIAGNLKRDWSRTAGALQGICRDLQGNCKGPARSLRGPACRNPRCLAERLQGNCRETARQLQGGPEGNLQGDCTKPARAC